MGKNWLLVGGEMSQEMNTKLHQSVSQSEVASGDKNGAVDQIRWWLKFFTSVPEVKPKSKGSVVWR